ncbi:MAG: type IV secretory system conjugative DNA transfer family protein [Candidatus Gastranaerophilales bacterium]|nr:type IV secretory system conjugative DNA transfer family protein [Candidatus Gastranaerophilales bacterium]
MNKMNGTKFISQEELKENLVEIDLEKKEYPYGGVPLSVQNGKAYVDAGDSHTIIFGATGSKKTRLLGMPMVEILSGAGESFVITDPKGEIYDKTVENVQRRGYQVFCINLRDFKAGNTWNPLALPYDFYRNGEKGKAVEMVSELSKMIIGEDLEDPFWTNSAADVITGLMLILLEKAKREECNIKSLITLWSQYLDSRKDTLGLVKALFGESLVRRKLGTLYSGSEKTVGSIEAIVATGINKLVVNEEFVEFLSQDGLEFDGVIAKKTAIYLIIPDENAFTHFVASLFLKQLYEVLIKAAQRQPECRLAIRMNYIVDEFANIPKINNMDSMITASRSRNIRFYLIVQSKMQMKNKYGDIAFVICDNCSNWIYLYSKDYELLNEISKLCGDVIYDNNIVMPLISEFELQHLNKEKGEALVLSGRNCPCIVNLADIDEYPAQKKRRMQKMDDGSGGAQSDIEEESWRPVSVFNMDKLKKCRERMEYEKDKDNERVYSYPFKKLVRARYGKRGKKIWLVGTYRGMILVNEVITEKELKTGEGILRVSITHFQKLEDAVELQWYTASPRLEFEHGMKLSGDGRDKIFLTIQELGEQHFKPVDNRLF